MAKRVGKWIIAIVVVVAIVGFVYWATGDDAEAEVTIDSTTIASSFEDVAELATQKYEFTDVGKRTEDSKDLFGVKVPLTGNSFLITYSGAVTAGIADFTAVEVEFQEAQEKVIVRLPQPEVLHAEIDPSTIVVYDQSFTPFNPTNVEDVTSFLAEETDRSTQKAIDGGLLERAKEQAVVLATEHVNAVLLGTSMAEFDVQVSFLN